MRTDDDLPIGMMGQPRTVIDHFWKMVDAGESVRLAEMLAVRRAPSLDTDTVHFAGLDMSHIAKTCGPDYANKIMKQAKNAGISVNGNSFDNGAIADERGGAEPGAWKLVGDGKDKFRKTVRDRGGACESLGVEFGESSERMQKQQRKLEKQRAKKKQFLTMQKQLTSDMHRNESGKLVLKD